ncbi:putative Carboxypeptidase B [Daphnia magna]|uniref:Zinc carboxypeptidase A 1 n=1 Tax=Daphnia magna TaxID=35525 RepID=A0A164SGY2_9CRUS|nr:putative Carboxypeptidase B [Daphnia magna]
MRKLFFFFLATISESVAQKHYDGYQVFEVNAKDKVSLEVLAKLQNEKSDVYDFWTEPRIANRPMDIMVPPAFTANFVELMQTSDIDYKVKIADVERMMEAKRKAKPVIHGESGTRSGAPRVSLNWESYFDLPVIEEFLAELATKHPNLMTTSVVGQSYEGNNMNLVKISTVGSDKKAIFIDGGILCLLLTLMAIVTPSLQMGTVCGRKNRRPNDGSACIGTDMNRNFDFHWDEGGSSDLPCAETYNGGAAFSEIESRIIRDTILGIANQTMVYLTVHSYGQYWLTPWGYTADLPANYDQLYDLAVRAVDKLTAVYGTQYTIGSSTNVLYVNTGPSDDWAMGGAGIPYAYTLELRDTGKYGFELPAEQIIPNNLETWEAIKVVAEDVMAM